MSLHQTPANGARSGTIQIDCREIAYTGLGDPDRTRPTFRGVTIEAGTVTYTGIGGVADIETSNAEPGTG